MTSKQGGRHHIATPSMLNDEMQNILRSGGLTNACKVTNKFV